MKKTIKPWLGVWGAMILLALGHYRDVGKGMAATGDHWLAGWYLTLVFLTFLGTAAFAVLFLQLVGKQQWSLERIYPLAGIFLGILYLAVLPPLSAPDEISHYIGSYQLSNRMMGKEQADDRGNVLLRGTDWFLEDVYGNYIYEKDLDGIWKNAGIPNEENQWKVLGQELREEAYRMIHGIGLKGEITPQEEKFGQAGCSDEEEQTVASGHQPVVTTPFAYVPQALGITLARIFHLNSIWLAYLGRFFNLLFFVTITTLAMRRLPFGKEILFGVALLPMTLHLSASFSYDVMIMGCFFYFTSVCLDLAYGKEKVEPKDVAVLMALIAVAGPCKMIYGVLMGLCLLIPVKKFGGWTRWALAALAVAGAWGIAMALINSKLIANFATASDQVVEWAGEVGYSVGFLLHNPGKLIQMFYQTILWQAEMYHLTMVGAYLGNMDQGLDVPYMLVVFFTFCLAALSLRKPGENLIVSGGKRIWIFVVCGACVAAAFGTMLIAWTPVSSLVISGVQGRYFLPFLPVFLMACKNDWLILTKDRNRSILYLMICANGYVLYRLFSIVCLRT